MNRNFIALVVYFIGLKAFALDKSFDNSMVVYGNHYYLLQFQKLDGAVQLINLDTGSNKTVKNLTNNDLRKASLKEINNSLIILDAICKSQNMSPSHFFFNSSFFALDSKVRTIRNRKINAIRKIVLYLVKAPKDSIFAILVKDVRQMIAKDIWKKRYEIDPWEEL